MFNTIIKWFMVIGLVASAYAGKSATELIEVLRHGVSYLAFLMVFCTILVIEKLEEK